MKFFIAVAKPSPDDIKKGLQTRFAFEFNSLYRNLIFELNIQPENIISTFFDSWLGGSSKSTYCDLEEFLIARRNEDVCVVYIGHGQEDGWALSGEKDVEALKYESLRLAFAQHSGNLIFLNCCCFGGAGSAALEAHAGESLLISPMPATHSGCCYSFFNALIRNWKSGIFYDPETSGDNTDSKPVVIGSPDLQRLFFLKTEKAA